MNIGDLQIGDQSIKSRKCEQTIRLKVSYKGIKYHIKVTQELSKFSNGHYCGYIEKTQIPFVQETAAAIADNSIIATFQSTGTPKEKLTITDIVEEFVRIIE
jgi:hypothetical protein